jgi:DNA-binding NarL/FixJ family response regulator
MNDPRQKRPSTQDLMDERHVQWLRSLRTKMRPEDQVIQLDKYVSGKTAAVLSERELEVLQFVSFGLSTVEIADRMYLSKHTITNHRKNMLARSRCGNLAELVRVAIQENLL